MLSVAIHGQGVFLTLHYKNSFIQHIVMVPVDEYARISASEIGVNDSIKSKQNMDLFSLDPLATES